MSPEYEVRVCTEEVVVSGERERVCVCVGERGDVYVILLKLLLGREKTDEKRLEGEEENNGYAYPVEVRLDLGKTDIKNVWKILEGGVPGNIFWPVHYLRHIQHLQSVSYCIIQNFCSNYQKG